MKILNVLFVLFFINYCFSQSFFKKTDLVDEFGDKIGEVQRNVTLGTFSNSATNNSPLRVHTILTIVPDYKPEEFEANLIKEYKKMGSTEKEIKNYLKVAKDALNLSKNQNGGISFDLYEYENNLPSMIGVKSGIISIKTSNNVKIQASLGEFSFLKNSITITGYKELTEGASGVKNQIKFGFYDWGQTEIYNAIVNATEPIMVVIVFDSSTYNFTLKQL